MGKVYSKEGGLCETKEASLAIVVTFHQYEIEFELVTVLSTGTTKSPQEREILKRNRFSLFDTSLAS